VSQSVREVAGHAQGRIVEKYAFPLDEQKMAEYLAQIAPPRAAAEAR